MNVHYPVIRLTDWMELLLGSCGGEFLLGGLEISEEEKYMDMFDRFWTRYTTVDPFHLVHGKSRDDQKRTIPVALHGDEGRGLCKLPVLIESFQLVIPWHGEHSLNSLGQLIALQ